MRNGTVTILQAPDQVTVGVPFSVTFRVTNQGNEYIIPGTDKLGTWNPQDGTDFTINRGEIPMPWIWPGQGNDVTVGGFVAKAPGVYPLQMRLLREGLEWYGSAGVAKAITAVAAAPAPGPTPAPAPAPAPTPNPSPSPSPNVPPFPPPRKDAGDVVSGWIVNTGAFAADAAVRKHTWAPPARFLIRRVRIWLGVSSGGRADCHGQLDRADGSTLAVLQADHYADGPHGAACEQFDFGMNYQAVEAGEQLTFTHFANGFVAGTQAHFTVLIWGHYA